MKPRKIIYKSSFILVTVFIACFFSQLLNFSNKVSILAGTIICMGLAVHNKKIGIDWRQILLCISMIFYTISVNRGISWSLVIVMLPVIFCYMGKSLATTDLGNEFIPGVMIAVIVIGYTTHGILNSIIYFKTGFVMGRAWEDIWSHVILPATQHVIYYLPAMAMFFPAIYCFKKRKFIYTGVLIANIFFVYMSLLTLSRTSIVIMVIVLVEEIVLAYVLNRKEKIGKLLYYCIAVLAIMVFLFAVLLIKTDFGQAFLNIMNRNGGILNNIRFKAQIEAVKQLFVYPWGGYHMELAGLEYAHNVWLDMANAAGVIPFFAFCVYTLASIWDLVKMIKDPVVSQEFKYIVSGLYSAFFLYYMVEPALEATVVYLIPWIFLNGMVSGYNIKDNKKEF